MHVNNTKQQPISGLHVVGRLQTRAQDVGEQAMKNFEVFASECIRRHSLQELGAYYHSFGEDGGFTGVICLAESHVAVHTWPESNYITLDVFLCNFSQNNEETCRSLFSGMCQFFSPVLVDKQDIIR